MRFREYREKAGYSQRDVAKLLNVTNASVHFWETGANMPRAELLPKIAKLYKCKVDDLLRE